MPKAHEWKEHIARQERSGQSVAEYCEAHGLVARSLTWWRSELRNREREGRTGHKQKVPQKPATVSRTNLSAVKMAKVVRAAPAASESTQKAGGLRVVLGGAQIFVDGNCDRRLLTELLAALGNGGDQ